MAEQVVNAYVSGSALVLLRRDEEGRRRERRQRAEHSFFLREPDFLKVEQEIRTAERRRLVLEVRREGDHRRVVCRDWEFRRNLVQGIEVPGDGRKRFAEEHGVELLEADVHPVSRWLVDSRAELLRPTHGSLDLETDSRVPFAKRELARVLCWNLARGDGERYGGVLEEDSDAAEAELLKDLLFELERVDQVRCWNGLKFDEVVLRARCRRLGIRVEWSRWLWLDQMLAFKKYNAHSAESGGEKESVALERVAESLGIDVSAKSSVDAAKSWEHWAAGGARRRALFERNAFDAWSMNEIERKTGYCDLHYAVCKTSGCLPDTRALRASVPVEAFMMRVGAERGVRFPTKRFFGSDEDERYEQFQGAFVHEPVPGIHREVHVCDFAGMYPTIIESLNISAETHVPELSGRAGESYLDVAARLPPNHCVAPRTLAVFRTDVEGILAVVIRTLKGLRKHWNERKKQFPPHSPEWEEADRLSQGCKIAVNSCFGVASSRYFRLYRREVGESITTTGAWLITTTLEKAVRELGAVPVGGDTDSLFLKGVSEEAFRAFKDECNRELYPALMRELRAPRCALELEFEKTYALQLVTGKKRYCARVAQYKGKRGDALTKPDVKGLEYMRGDQLRITRDFQKQAIWRLMLHGVEYDPRQPYPLVPEDFHDLVASWKRRVLEDEIARRDVVISQGMKGPPESYVKAPRKDGSPATLPIHVRVALVLQERGADVSEGARIEYVVTDGDATPAKAIPADDYVPGTEDRAYIWEKEVWPPVRRLLEAAWPEHNWTRFDEGKDRGGGRGRSAYLPGQVHFGFWDS